MITYTLPAVLRRFRVVGILLALVLLLLPATTSAAPCRYTVQQGDTLARISGQSGSTISGILQANPSITDPNLIYPGQILFLPECGGAVSAAPAVPSVPAPVVVPIIVQQAPAVAQPNPEPPADLAEPLWQQIRDATLTVRHPIETPFFGGSGIVVGTDGRTFVTAYHVISNTLTGTQATRVSIGPFADWRYTADVIATAPTLDLAVLRVNEPDFPGFGVVPLGSASALTEGDAIYTVSYPGAGTLSTGKGRYLARLVLGRYSTPLIATDASATFGSSGGVAVDEQGRVIGIITAGLLGRRSTASIGYPGLDQATLIVPIDAAAEFLRSAGVR